MKKINKFFRGLRRELRRPATVRAAQLVLCFALMFALFPVSSTSASTASSAITTIDLDSTSLIKYRQWTLSGSNAVSYTYDDPTLSPITGSPIFNLSQNLFRSYCRVTEYYPPDANGTTASVVTFDVSYALPSFPPSDELFFVFSTVARLYDTYEDPIEDCHVVINGVSYEPSIITNSSTGDYYTYTIKVDNANTLEYLGLSYVFGDFPIADQKAMIFSNPMRIAWQLSPITVHQNLAAATAYAASIDTLLKNDIGPSLENIEALGGSILGELENMDKSVEEGFTAALDKLVEQEATEGDSAINGIINQIKENVNLSIVDDLMGAYGNLSEAISGTNTDFSLTFPALSIPEIPGLMPKHTLTKAYTFDFQQVIDLFPELFWGFLQNVCSFILCVFVVRDFLDTLMNVISGNYINATEISHAYDRDQAARNKASKKEKSK